MELRKELFDLCCAYAEARIRVAKEAMQQAQQAANAEEKSTAGDKYETGRAMAHLEKEKAAAQLFEANKLKEVLHKINPEITTQRQLSEVLLLPIKEIIISLSVLVNFRCRVKNLWHCQRHRL
jgi:hypothetical protein